MAEPKFTWATLGRRFATAAEPGRRIAYMDWPGTGPLGARNVQATATILVNAGKRAPEMVLSLVASGGDLLRLCYFLAGLVRDDYATLCAKKGP